MQFKRSIFFFIMVCAGLSFSARWIPQAGAQTREEATARTAAHDDLLLDGLSATPSPTYDPLATPLLPANPSDFEMGEYLYYFHCMPCHGDSGQGLTDDFRNVWVEDHRNCWDRGCHGGRVMDEGFPIPTVVPQIIATDDALPQFTDFIALQAFLHDTHPPQYPGKLEDRQYRDLTAFLWASNDKPTLTPTLLETATEEASQTPAPKQRSSATPSISRTPRPVQAQPVEAQLPTPINKSSMKTPPDVSILPTSMALIALVMVLLGYFLFRSGSKHRSDR